MKEYSLLLSGGGTNGVVYVGVFRKLRELNISIKKLLGVSIGSIFGLVYILNYSNEEIYDILINTDFNMFKKNIKFSNFKDLLLFVRIANVSFPF
jgi:predicted acylesterase/phospholipase RssA